MPNIQQEDMSISPTALAFKPPMPSLFHTLPIEVILNINTNLTLFQRIPLAKTCRYLYATLAQEPLAWRTIDLTTNNTVTKRVNDALLRLLLSTTLSSTRIRSAVHTIILERSAVTDWIVHTALYCFPNLEFLNLRHCSEINFFILHDTIRKVAWDAFRHAHLTRLWIFNTTLYATAGKLEHLSNTVHYIRRIAERADFNLDICTFCKKDYGLLNTACINCTRQIFICENDCTNCCGSCSRAVCPECHATRAAKTGCANLFVPCCDSCFPNTFDCHQHCHGTK